jgi:putative addiction module CopG family antidote
MDITLTPEQERIIEDAVNSGRFRTAAEVIGEALQALLEQRKSSPATESDEAQSEAVREMLAFVKNNAVRLDGTSTKELIHEGHRL